MFEPLFKVHTTVGMILNGFLKTTATVCLLFAAISTAPVVPDCVLLFYDGFTDSLDGGQLIVLHDALSILLFESAIDLM